MTAAMRWGRGFFRLWLFLSATWVAGSIYFIEPKTYAYLWRAPILEFETNSGQHFEFDTSHNREQLAAEITAALQRDTGQTTPNLPTTRDQLLNFIDSETEKISNKARFAWLATCAPPLALFGFGLCIAWILRGFHPQKSSPS